MRVMILAAGRGERMRPLTDACPKPLLQVGAHSLIEWHIQNLVAAGLTQIVINHAWLGSQIEQALGDGRQFGAEIQYSPEGSQGFETAGGVATAMPLLGQAPFMVINGDIFTDIDFAKLKFQAASINETDQLAHLVLVENPEHHLEGDFGLLPNGNIEPKPLQGCALTFSGVGIYHSSLFADTPAHQSAKLAPILRDAMNQGLVTGQKHIGLWLDVGTIGRLEEARTIALSRHPH